MPLRVYYLDDEPDLCEMFSDYCASAEVMVVTFCDPQLALQSIREAPPDLLFLDYRLPGVTGDDIAQTVDPRIPKFLITGDISVRTKYKFEKIFFKPYTEDEILVVIQRYLASKRGA